MEKLIIDLSAKMLKALANEKRLEILFNLMKKEQTVTELEKLVKISQSALSQHLAVLREHKIVKTKRDAQNIFYSIDSKKALEILELLQKLYSVKY